MAEIHEGVHTLTDEEIKKDVTDELYWDSRVNAADISVDVDAGRVVLSGSVPSYSAREAAQEDACVVAGVDAVENRLVVSYTVAVPADSEIRSNIDRTIALDPDLNAADIRVDVDAGNVTLRGTVDKYWKKFRAANLAGSQLGVLTITNELAVVPTGDFLDKDIANNISRALERNVNVDAANVGVRVQDGVVSLEGTVSSRSAMRAARRAARHTPGVIDVDDHMTSRVL